MTKMASQITSLTVVYSTVYSDADQIKHQSSASLAFVWGFHRDRWIPRTKGQLRGKCFHLMTSLCEWAASMFEFFFSDQPNDIQLVPFPDWNAIGCGQNKLICRRFETPWISYDVTEMGTLRFTQTHKKRRTYISICVTFFCQLRPSQLYRNFIPLSSDMYVHKSCRRMLK